jgi:DNA-binding transcriptional LysR family regulator
MAQLLKQDSPVRDFDLLKSLEIFLVVAEVGNMTAAAGRLHITQSAISQQIKMLEQDFGGPLFYRDVRPLRLTPAGATLKNRAGALLLEARQLRSEVRQAAFGNMPHLRIAILSTFARHLVPAILRAVQSKDLAATNVTISRGLTVNHAQDLSNRDIDIAFTSDNFEERANLQHVELLREGYLVITPRGQGRDVQDLRAIGARLPFLRYSARTQSGQRIEGHLRRMRMNFPRAAHFESAGDLVEAVSSGYGWSIISPSQLLDPLEAGCKIDAVPLPRPRLSRAIGIVCRSGEMTEAFEQLTRVCLETLESETLPRLQAALPRVQFQFEILRSTST